ncbi:MAG TPA: N-acetylmuramoyl-L-alanine amidase [Thermoanaerobaculia bacterium]|nr:N-acetylmuramoyl-L-alanine amidase [Thermoanaerobaculia bacterium]
MANFDRLKRRLVQDLVQENVDLIRGHVRPPRRRRQRFRFAGALALLLPALVLFGSSGLVSTLSVAANPPRRGAAAAGELRPSSSLPGRPAAIAAPTSSVAVASPARTPGAEPAVDASVFPLAIRKIAIDAGHGGDSLGTRTPSGLLEKDVTLDIADRLRRILEDGKSFQVLMTRDSDRAVSLEERAAYANRMGADIFVSVHVNWIGNREARGVETYFLGPTDDPFLTRLAAAENRDSGYSLADMRPLLERIYAGVRQDKSRKLAEMVQASLFRSLGKVNPRMEDRGVKSAPFIVLLATQMPAILAEVSCLSNEEEGRLLAKPLYRQYIAEALASGLRSYAGFAQGIAEKGI